MSESRTHAKCIYLQIFLQMDMMVLVICLLLPVFVYGHLDSLSARSVIGNPKRNSKLSFYHRDNINAKLKRAIFVDKKSEHEDQPSELSEEELAKLIMLLSGELIRNLSRISQKW